MMAGDRLPPPLHPFDRFHLRSKNAGREICKEAVFILVVRLPAMKTAPRLTRRSSDAIEYRRPDAPAHPGGALDPSEVYMP